MTKTVVLMPNANEKLQKLNRFHPDAAQQPLLQMVQWTRWPLSSERETIQLAMDGDKQRLYEFHQIANNKTRSWFIGNDVHKNGAVVMLTQMDPMFVLISTTWHKKDRFHSIYDLFSESHNLWWLELQSVCMKTVANVCEIQNHTEEESIDNLYVKADTTKILEFLDIKVDKIARELCKQCTQNGSQAANSMNSNFVLPQVSTTTTSNSSSMSNGTCSTSQRDVISDSFRREAIEILSEYVPEQVVELLYKRLSIPSKAPNPAHEQTSTEFTSMEDQIRRFDVRNNTNTTTNNKRSSDKAGSSVNRKQSNKLAKVDTRGMKSISSFFGKK